METLEYQVILRSYLIAGSGDFKTGSRADGFGLAAHSSRLVVDG